ncbi:MAG: TonB family protein [Bacteroidota bacterium]
MSYSDSFNDIIFKYKNKNYGAYAMRKSYKKNLFYAVLITVGLVVFFPLFQFFKSHSSEKKFNENLYFSESLNMPPLKKPVDDNSLPPEILKLLKKAKFTVPKVVIDMDDTPQNLDDNALNSDSARAGSNTGSTNGILDGNGASDDAIYTYVQEMPSFPGGDEAFNVFLRKNIRYPQLARQSKIQGIVYVYFIVEKDGSLSNIKIVQGIGAGCDDEALRVMHLMPKWKAGKKQGREIRIQMLKPINFVLQSNT